MDIGYLYIPEYIMAMDDLSLQEKVVYGRIVGLTGEKGYCFATNEWLGKQIGLSADRVKKIISRLNKLSIIYVHVKRYTKKTRPPHEKWTTRRRIYAFANAQTPLGVENAPQVGGENDPYSIRDKNIHSISEEKTTETSPMLGLTRHAKKITLNKKKKALKKKYPFGIPHYEKIEEDTLEPLTSSVTITPEYRKYCEFISKDRGARHIPKSEGQTLWDALLNEGYKPADIKCASRIAYTIDEYWIDKFYPEFFFRRTNKDGNPIDNIDKFSNIRAGGDPVIVRIKQEWGKELGEI